MVDGIHTDTIVRVDSIQIRPARLSDLNQLAALCEALWPESSATEHAQELRLILGDKAALVLTMPLIIFVAEANGGTLAGFLEVDLRYMRTAATHHGLWDTSRAGTLLRITATAA